MHGCLHSRQLANVPASDHWLGQCSRICVATCAQRQGLSSLRLNQQRCHCAAKSQHDGRLQNGSEHHVVSPPSLSHLSRRSALTTGIIVGLSALSGLGSSAVYRVAAAEAAATTMVTSVSPQPTTSSTSVLGLSDPSGKTEAASNGAAADAGPAAYTYPFSSQVTWVIDWRIGVRIYMSWVRAGGKGCLSCDR
jgi:hypothetical protein